MAISRDEILRNAHNVASLPLIYTRINEAVDERSSSMAAIGAIIQEDTGLSARILRLANSAFYGYPSQIGTIEKALTIIGLKPMRDLALATSMMQIFKDIPEDVINMKSFWEHSIACGVTARILAIRQGQPNAESYFLGGILHDIGQLILLQQIPQQIKYLLQLGERQNTLIVELERKEFGFDHASLGGRLLRMWKLPGFLISMVAAHHNPSSATQFKKAAAVIHFADILAHTLKMGASCEKNIPKLDKKAWEILELSPATLPIIAEQVRIHYDSAAVIILE